MLGNIFEACFLIGLVIASVIRTPYAIHYKRRRTAEGRLAGQDWPFLVLAFLGMQVIPLVYLFGRRLDFADYHLPAQAGLLVGWAGVAVYAVAQWLFWRSHVDLGRNWSPYVETGEEQVLVTGGVYKRVRHPMYTAHLLLAIGQALLLQNWIAGLSFLVAFVPFYVRRVAREEQVMLERFGEDYQSYMDRTGRLLPRPRE